MPTVRIGVGAGFAEDRIEPAADLADRGELDFLVFECLGERTIALAQLERRRDPAKGYDPLLAERMNVVLATCVANGVRIITNSGAANPVAACEVVADVARRSGLSHFASPRCWGTMSLAKSAIPTRFGQRLSRFGLDRGRTR